MIVIVNTSNVTKRTFALETMKLYPPKIQIDVEQPFKEAFYDRQDFAASLTALLRNVTDNLVVFVNAPWGEGKTTFAKMWEASLRHEKLDVIYFDAYAADYFEDPFLSFSGEILELAKKRFPNTTGIVERREFKKTAVEVGKRLGGLAFKIGVRAATMGAVEAAHLSELKDIASDVSAGVSEIGADVIEKKIENHAAEKDALTAFKRSLQKLAAVVRADQEFPLTILVDELDRCRPDFALGLLERIKHLFDVEGVAFVLFVNRDQIETYIRSVYGTDDAAAYLLKFGNVFVDLPNEEPMFRSAHGRSAYCDQLARHFELAARNDGDHILRSIDNLVAHFALTLREMERAFGLMSLYYGSLPDGQFTHPFLVPLLSVLKIKRPLVYRQLRTRKISIGEFFRETELDKLETSGHRNINIEWITDALKFCLMSEAEFDVANKDSEGNRDRRGLGGMGHMLINYNISRESVIPFLAERLDRFSFAPSSGRKN
jgi:hypothetical protein